MREIYPRKLIFCFFFPCLLLVSLFSQAQSISDFELKNGDRVVFLGNALIENEQFYNYLEYRLTRHWPDRSITFRNLGWSGDNVFGDARSHYTSPPTSYELLLSQLTDAKPTLVLLAYGSVEAHEGEKGLDRFSQGLNSLMDKISDLGSEVILLSPIPQFSGPSESFMEKRKKDLQLYASKIEEIAKSKNKRYINLLDPLAKSGKEIWEDGVHLNEYGYYQLSTWVEKGFGLQESSWNVTLDLASNRLETQLNGKLIASDLKNGQLQFSIEPEILPVPVPTGFPNNGVNGSVFTIKGLKKGYYTLAINDRQQITASAKAWSDGVLITQGGPYDQAEQLRQLLNKKDEVFFFQYRPLNETYIVGFRRYEQGRHLKDLEDFDVVLTWLQGQITAAKKPKLTHYTLYPTP